MAMLFPKVEFRELKSSVLDKDSSDLDLKTQRHMVILKLVQSTQKLLL